MADFDLSTVFSRLGHPKVLVVGDLILDCYTFGDAERVSQEAPVILLRADTREARLGGAANVAHMLRGLEADVTVAGVVGPDSSGKTLRQLLCEAGVSQAALLTDLSRPTTVKERFIGRAQGRHPHQILRVDNEVRDALAYDLETRLARLVEGMASSFDIVLISDYGKGVCTPRLLRKVIAAARAAGKPVLVDPCRSADYASYRGATTMTPNRHEAELATGLKIVAAEDAFEAGRRLCRDLELDFAVVTLDRDGMALVQPDARERVFPTRPRAVYDITGAGDMVLAMIGLCLACGVSPDDAIRLGNVAGGLEVEKVGVAIVPRSEIAARLAAERSSADRKLVEANELEAVSAEHRAAGRRLVFTNGCFDLLHVGHVTYLQEAARLGDVLVVGVNSDTSVRRLKGPTRPVIGERDRACMLAALACVDHVVIFDEDTPHQLLERLRPDVLVKGGTYTADQVVGHEVVERYGGHVCVTGVVGGISTTTILASLAKQHAVQGPHYPLAGAASPPSSATCAKNS